MELKLSSTQRTGQGHPGLHAFRKTLEDREEVKQKGAWLEVCCRARILR